MNIDNMVYLKHILDAINLIEEYLKGRVSDGFMKNRMLQDAVVREIEIIGEASKSLSTKLRDKYSEISWKQIAGMRDKLIHSYFGVDLEVVWDTINKDIPHIKPLIIKMLENIKD